MGKTILHSKFNTSLNRIHPYHRFVRKSPDTLIEDFLYGRGEFSVQASESAQRRLKENMKGR